MNYLEKYPLWIYHYHYHFVTFHSRWIRRPNHHLKKSIKILRSEGSCLGFLLGWKPWISRNPPTLAAGLLGEPSLHMVNGWITPQPSSMCSYATSPTHQFFPATPFDRSSFCFTHFNPETKKVVLDWTVGTMLEHLYHGKSRWNSWKAQTTKKCTSYLPCDFVDSGVI